MSVGVNLQKLPSHILSGVKKQENIQIDRSLSKFKVAPWDLTPIGDDVILHLSYYRNPRLLLSEKALRLAYRHARQSNRPQFTCFLLGTFIVDRDEEGVTLSLDRLDPGRENPGSGGKEPSSSMPGDVVVPFIFEAQHVSPLTSSLPAQHADDLSASFKTLQQSCSGKKTMEASQLLLLRGWLGCKENADSLAFSLQWVGVTTATVLKATPIRSIPIIPTALARNLSSPASQVQPLGTAHQKRGFLSLDQTSKLLLILESDPKIYTLPLVGVWLCGVTHIYSPQVWAWCLRFLSSSFFQERVLSERGAFLVVLYSLTHREPQFYQCQPTSDHKHMDLLLLTSAESLTLYKKVEPNERKPLVFELRTGSEKQETDFYKEVMSRLASSSHVPGATGTSSPQHKLPISDNDSGVEDEDLSPRPSPNPHPAGEQVDQVQPTVPELSLVMDGSFLGGTAKPPSSTPYLPVPVRHQRELVGFPKAPSEPNGFGPNRIGAGTPVSRTTTPTMSKKGCEGSTGFSPSLLPLRSSPPKMAASPDGASELFRPYPGVGCAQETKAFAPELSGHSQSPDRIRCSNTASAQPQTQQCGFPSSAVKSLSSCCQHRHHTAPPHQSHPWPDAPPPSAALHPMTTPPPPHKLPAVVSCAPRSTPPRGGCLSPPHRTPPHLDCLQRCAPSRSPNPVQAVSPLQAGQSQEACVGVSDNCHNMLSVDAYRILMDQDRQLRLLQAQIQKLLEAQSQSASSQPSDHLHQSRKNPGNRTPGQSQTSPEVKKKNSVSIAIGTGASLFCGNGEDEWWKSASPGTLSNSTASSRQASPLTRSQTHTNGIKDFEDETSSSDQNHKESQQMSPGPGQSLQSLVLGESASMCFQHQSARTDDLHSQSVTADQKFFQDLLGQVKDRLQDSSEEEEPSHSKCESRSAAPTEIAPSPVMVQACSPVPQSPAPSLKALSKSSSRSTSPHQQDPVYSATVKHLEKLGVCVDGKGTSTNVAVESASTLASINPEAVIPRLAVSDFLGASMFTPECSADLSLEANSIALRYLSDIQLSRLSLSRETRQTSSAARPSMAFLGKTIGTERTVTSLSILSPTNMSLATQKYMKRYGLIEEDNEDEDEDDYANDERQEQQNDTNHDSALGCSAQIESPEKSEAVQKAIRAPSSPPHPHNSPHLEQQGQSFRDGYPTVQLLLRSHKPPENSGPRGKSSPQLPSAIDNRPVPGTMDTQGSLGNFLDLSRLRQLPKLF